MHLDVCAILDHVPRCERTLGSSDQIYFLPLKFRVFSYLLAGLLVVVYEVVEHGVENGTVYVCMRDAYFYAFGVLACFFSYVLG